MYIPGFRIWEEWRLTIIDAIQEPSFTVKHQWFLLKDEYHGQFNSLITERKFWENGGHIIPYSRNLEKRRKPW